MDILLCQKYVFILTLICKPDNINCSISEDNFNPLIKSIFLILFIHFKNIIHKLIEEVPNKMLEK